MPKKKKTVGSKMLFTAILLILSSLMTMAVTNFDELEHLIYPTQPVTAMATGNIEVHMIDVDQASCTLIMTSTSNVLIDGGTVSSSAEVIDYLDSLGVQNLDYVINTHPHADHLGGFYKIMPHMDSVEKVIITNLPQDVTPQTRSWEQFLTSVGEMGAELSVVQAGAQYNLGDGAVLTMLGPTNPVEDFNDSSIICRLDFGSADFLFMGDASVDMVTDLARDGADISAEVLQVGHHGSYTSTDDLLLRLVNPSISMISCGADNEYGHPHREVTTALEQYNIPIYRTDLQGNIVVRTDGQTLEVLSEYEQSAAA